MSEVDASPISGRLSVDHHGMAPCHEQPGKQGWFHWQCIVRHPLRYLRSRGPRRWRYGGGPIA
jgi:hypothetical protein